MKRREPKKETRRRNEEVGEQLHVLRLDEAAGSHHHSINLREVAPLWAVCGNTPGKVEVRSCVVEREDEAEEHCSEEGLHIPMLSPLSDLSP